MADANAIMALLKRVSKHYDLDYTDVLSVCDLTSRNLHTDNDNLSDLEFISINQKCYLHNPVTNQIYSNEKKPRLIGHLCTESFEVILY